MKFHNSDIDPLVRIRAVFPTLRASEKRVADYIDKNSSKIVYLSIGTLAANCDVSETSVIRLCKSLGYSGYQELKINIAKFYVAPDRFIHSDVSEMDSISQIINKVMKSDMDAISDTMKLIDPSNVEACIEVLSKANRIEFYGLGGSGAVALDAHHKFFKYGITCATYSDSHMQAMSASLLGKYDVVVAISYSGNTKDIVDSLKEAKKSGATTICITSSVNSPITKVADHTILAIAKEVEYKTEPMAARIAQLSIIDILAVGVSIKRRNTVVENLDKTRNALLTKKY